MAHVVDEQLTDGRIYIESVTAVTTQKVCSSDHETPTAAMTRSSSGDTQNAAAFKTITYIAHALQTIQCEVRELETMSYCKPEALILFSQI